MATLDELYSILRYRDKATTTDCLITVYSDFDGSFEMNYICCTGYYPYRNKLHLLPMALGILR